MGDTQDKTPPRLSAAVRSKHGLDNRGLEAGAIAGVGYGRFGRMFPFAAAPLPDQCLRDIAEAMIKSDKSKPLTEAEPIDENPAVPSGYTYFGQFVDHDLTLDTTPIGASNVDVAALEDFRTPALDLDCIYGRGPDDQPYMYAEDGLHLRLGDKLDSGDSVAGTRQDLLRLKVDGETTARAIIGDKRNDENRLVAQIHSVFIAFHNKVVDDKTLIAAVGGDFGVPASRFKAAVQIVRWHYQWLVVNDFLHRVLEPNIISDILGAGGAPDIPHYDKPKANWAYIPVEFAGAAYRFGHSMIRPGYSLNSEVRTSRSDDAENGRIPIFSATNDTFENLNGFGVPIPKAWGIDWSFFLDHVKGKTKGFQLPQPSYRIDAQLVAPLEDLPEFSKETEAKFKNLAFRNLLRGTANLRLPSGEQVANVLCVEPLGSDILWGAGSRTVGKVELTDEESEELEATAERRKKVFDAWVNGDGDQGQCLHKNTPLWYYILREAEYFGTDRVAEGATSAFGGQYLGPVGSRIVAETFIGLLWNDPNSYLRRWPNFKPMAPIAPEGQDFKLGHLISWAMS